MNSNNSDRFDQIKQGLESLAQEQQEFLQAQKTVLQELQVLATNAKAQATSIQAFANNTQALNTPSRNEEARVAEHNARIARLDATIARLNTINEQETYRKLKRLNLPENVMSIEYDVKEILVDIKKDINKLAKNAGELEATVTKSQIKTQISNDVLEVDTRTELNVLTIKVQNIEKRLSNQEIMYQIIITGLSVISFVSLASIFDLI